MLDITVRCEVLLAPTQPPRWRLSATQFNKFSAPLHTWRGGL